MLCILSASMSTLSAQFHTMGAAFGADAFPKLGRSKNPNSTLGVRIGVLCSILVSYVICYTLRRVLSHEAPPCSWVFARLHSYLPISARYIGKGYPARGLGQLMGRRLGQFIRHVVPS